MDSEKLKQQQIAIDQQQLGLNNDILKILDPKNKNVPSDSSQKALYARWSMEWKDLNPSSSAMDRLMFISKLFDQHFINPLFSVDAMNVDKVIYVDLFTQCLSGYDVVLFLNDLHEIQSVYTHSPSAVHCESTKSEKECVSDSMRKYREWERVYDKVQSKMNQKQDEFHKFMDGLDESERAIVETSIRMHEVLCHSEGIQQANDDNDNDEKHKVRPLSWWKHRETQIASKFVNEVFLEENEQKESEQESRGRMDELYGALMDCWLREGVYAKIKETNNEHELNGKKVQILNIIQKERKCGVKVIEELPTTYVVVGKSGARCNTAKELSSSKRCQIPTGSLVNVVEIDGRRARIVRPNDGWVSLFSKKGTVLLEKATTLPTTYIVVGKDGAVCRVAKGLESEKVSILPSGSVVNVQKIQGRQAKIDNPVKGWVSLRTQNDNVLLERGNIIPFGQLEPSDDIAISRSDCAEFTKYLVENKYDSEAVLNDLIDDENDPFNAFKESNLFPLLTNNKFLTKVVKRHLGGNRNDDDKLPQFQFGEKRWLFWKETKYRYPDQFNTAKHSNLKEECLNNKIHSISLERFLQILTKAMLLKKSKKGRTIKARNFAGSNYEKGVPPGLPLTVSHIVVLLMYCNDTQLQYKYKKFGTRKTSREQTNEDFKEMNAEIGTWYRLLCEVVALFGSICHSKNVFFTGLNVRLSFSSFAPEFNAPFSTTISIDVASRFCDGAGIILMLAPSAGSNDRYFDVEWLSDFWHEKERLFTKASSLNIADILYAESGQMTKNQIYLKALSIFSKLFGGQFLGKIKGQRKAERILQRLISVFSINNGIRSVQENNGQFEPISLYIQQLFFNLVQEFKSESKHFVILSEFEKLSDELQVALFQFERSTHQLTLSPFLSSVCDERSIHFVQEHVWVIHGAQLSKLQQGAVGYMAESEEYHYPLNRFERITCIFDVDRKTGGTTNTGFGLKIKDCPLTMRKDVVLHVIVDEVDWSYKLKRSNLKKGSSDGVIAFADKLVEKVHSLTYRIAIYFE